MDIIKIILSREKPFSNEKIIQETLSIFYLLLRYVLVINFMASAINDSLDEFNLDEALSVKGMKAGQKDILVAARIKLKISIFNQFKIKPSKR